MPKPESNKELLVFIEQGSKIVRLVLWEYLLGCFVKVGLKQGEMKQEDQSESWRLGEKF